MSPSTASHVDWSSRRALERRMRGRVFRDLSRAMAISIVQDSLGALIDATGRVRATSADVLLAARCQGIAAHLLSLADRDRGALPRQVHEGLGAEAERIAQRSVRLAGDLSRLGEAASLAGVPFVPLKGSYLAWARYPQPALRPCADIDLLVRGGDVPAWRALLDTLGYTCQWRTKQHLVFTGRSGAPTPEDGDHPDHPRPVELHEQIADTVLGRPIDITSAYWDHVEAGSLLGHVPALVPRPVALALHLVLHSARNMLDRGLRIAQLLDLRFVEDSPDVLAAVSAQLGEVAWAVTALAIRDAPGLLRPSLVAACAGSAPSARRQRVILSRPGLLRGDPYRVTTLTGELLLTGSPARTVRRVMDAWADRASLDSPDRARGPAAYVASLAAYLGLHGRKH